MIKREHKHKTNIGVYGTYREVWRSNETGKIIDEFEERNVIVDSGILNIKNALTVADSNASVISSIWLGNDVGNGDVMSPELPTPETEGSEQDIIWQVPSEEFFVSYPSDNEFRFYATINGQSVMESFPGVPNVVYTSASLRTMAGIAFSYKRFTGRTISNLISVDISWTIGISRVAD